MGLFSGAELRGCCGCFTLRTGVFVLSGLTIINGLAGLVNIQLGWPTMVLGVIQIVCGGYGLFSAQNKDPEHLLYYWYFQVCQTILTICYVVLVLAFLLYGWGMIASSGTDVRDAQGNKVDPDALEAGKQQLGIFTLFAIVFGALSIVWNLYGCHVTYALYEVQLAGGNGDEWLTAEEVKKGGGAGERTALMGANNA